MPGSEGEGCEGTRRGEGGEASLVGRGKGGGDLSPGGEGGSQDPTSGSCSLGTAGFQACSGEKRILKSNENWKNSLTTFCLWKYLRLFLQKICWIPGLSILGWDITTFKKSHQNHNSESEIQNAVAALICPTEFTG